MEATIGVALLGASVVMTILAKKLAAGRPLGNVGMIVTPVLVAGYALGILLLAGGLR